MTQTSYGLTAIGNALVDILSHVDDMFLTNYTRENGAEKGTMSLINAEQALTLYGQLPNRTEASGGSAANTMAGYASLGGKGAFIGKTADDALGTTFRKDLRGIGTFYNSHPLSQEDEPTGRCMILITPDAQRTMNTFLGASTELTDKDIDAELIESSDITYLEGYLFDKETAKNAFIKASDIAQKAGKRIALTLSDPFCVNRHREDFLKLVENHIDILFANEEEIKALYQTDTFEEAATRVHHHVSIAALTRGDQGASIYSKFEDKPIHIDAFPVEHVLDTTGAGDQFAAGFLYGLSENLSLETCGKLGCLAAAEVISHTGPRPQTNLRQLAKDQGLL